MRCKHKRTLSHTNARLLSHYWLGSDTVAMSCQDSKASQAKKILDLEETNPRVFSLEKSPYSKFYSCYKIFIVFGVWTAFLKKCFFLVMRPPTRLPCNTAVPSLHPLDQLWASPLTHPPHPSPHASTHQAFWSSIADSCLDFSAAFGRKVK